MNQISKEQFIKYYLFIARAIDGENRLYAALIGESSELEEYVDRMMCSTDLAIRLLSVVMGVNLTTVVNLDRIFDFVYDDPDWEKHYEAKAGALYDELMAWRDEQIKKSVMTT